MEELYGIDTTTQAIIGEKEIREAAATLAEYKRGKGNLEDRVVEDEMWWELRHWEAIRGQQRGNDGERRIIGPEPKSAWLFNSLQQKHADAMDNYPEPIVLPRERSDEESAKLLSEVLPVVMQSNDFENTYSDAWWEKLKHGTAVYSVTWDQTKENGLGDISIQQLDLLKVFWEAGVTNIQDSRNLFIVELVDEDLLNDAYPEFNGKLSGQDIDVKKYIYSDTIDVDVTKKALVVDWYYKRNIGGKTILHLCKFVGKNLLYSSENDPETRETGIYAHGEYPVVFDVMYPEKGTPVGFGYIAICKDPQTYIDKLQANILESSLIGTKTRYFMSESTNVNEDEFLDANKPIVHVTGELSDMRLQPIVTNPPSPLFVEMMNGKVDEMKETSSNRDVNSGSAANVTAAAAISALQEAGNKTSRDMISASYRAHKKISAMVIELMRQFYDEYRSFRITLPNGQYDFVDMNNAGIKEQPNGYDADGGILYRKPIFDLKITAQKTNPFSRMEQNERAKELYAMGFFNPDNAQASLMALEAMNFEGIEKLKEQISQGATLLNMVKQLSQENAMLQADLGMAVAPPVAPEEAPEDGGRPIGAQPDKSGSTGLASAVSKAGTPMTGYGQRLAKRSTPSIDNTPNGATPR